MFDAPVVHRSGLEITTDEIVADVPKQIHKPECARDAYIQSIRCLGSADLRSPYCALSLRWVKAEETRLTPVGSAWQ